VVVSLGIAVFPALKNIIAPGIGSTKTGKDGMTLLYVPAGEFTMGNDNDSDDEKPVHPVTLDAFWVDQTEVTNAMYAKCVDAGACSPPTSTSSYTRDSYYGNFEFGSYPVIYVSWNDAKAYCKWADRRLPTEAEWEKAASWNDATQEKYTYPWGNDAPTNDLLNYKSEVGDTTKVGNYPEGASPYGALDMAGNVWELVGSLYQPYPYDAGDGRENLNSTDARALRGGSWNYIDYEVRSARRGLIGPTKSDYYVGFRCALSENEPAGSAPFAQVATDKPAPTETLTPTQTSISPTPTLGIGSTLISNKDGMILLYVPAGEFIMGSNTGASAERPAHTVYLDAFWIDKTEVTNAMYAKCVQDGSCQPPDFHRSSTRESYFAISEFNNYPVIYVSWEDAKTYCEWANRRLPTEAEWEKAARGENAFIYPWGNDFDGSLVNFCDKDCSFDWADKNSDDGYPDTAPIGSYPNGASPYGALDMAGNVWEWVADRYDGNYYGRLGENGANPQGPDSGQFRILRGGSWGNVQDAVHSALRYNFDPSVTGDYVGFRCAMSATP